MKKLTTIASVLALSIASLATPVEALEVTNEIYNEEGVAFQGLGLGVTVIYQDSDSGQFEYGWQHGTAAEGETISHDISDFVKRQKALGHHWRANFYLTGTPQAVNRYFAQGKSSITHKDATDNQHFTVGAKKIHNSDKYELVFHGG